MLGQLIHDQLHGRGVIRPVEEDGLVERAIFLQQACSAKDKGHIELVFLQVGILQLYGHACKSAFCTFVVQGKIIIGMLSGRA